MSPDGWDVVDELQRQLRGEPPRKEILLGPDALMTLDKVVKHVQCILKKKLDKYKK